MTDDAFVKEIRDDLRELRKDYRELTKFTTTVALQEQRLVNVEDRVGKIEDCVLSVKKSVGDIRTTCIRREHWFQGTDAAISHDDWLSLFLGGAVRNGVWIAITAMITTMVNVMMR